MVVEEEVEEEEEEQEAEDEEEEDGEEWEVVVNIDSAPCRLQTSLA